MPKKNTHEEQTRVEDYYARRRDFMIQVYEEDREHKIEFYKQIMILSVAGLGFNLSPPIRGANSLGWLPDNAWSLSIWGFFLAIPATLLLFYLRSWSSELWSELLDPDLENKAHALRLAQTLGKIINVLTIAITLSFTCGIISAIISLM